MPTEDVQITPLGTSDAPATWVLPAASEIIPKVVRAIFDGSGASGSFKPTLEIVSDAGIVVATVPTDETVAAGASAEVTWFPKWKRVGAGGICPGYPGGDVCGGMTFFGAFAEGHGGGLTTVLHVSRTVNCDSVVVVVGCALSQAGDGGAIITACVDSKGNRYNPGISSTSDQTVGPTNGLEVSMAVTAFASGGLVAGDTITITWDPSVTVVGSECMAVALVNTSVSYLDSNNGISFPGTAGTDANTLEWGSSVGLPTAGFGGFVGTVLCAIGATPNVGTNFTQAVLLDAFGSGSVALGVGLIPSLTSGDTYEPGGTTGGATVSVANYLELAA